MTSRQQSAGIDPLPLSEVRVIELTDGSGETAARLLADMGADVVRVEPATGALSRTQQPLFGEMSIYFETHNLNKRGVALDLTHPSGQNHFQRLVQSAHILIEGLGTAGLEERGIHLGSLRHRFPGLVTVSISDFGRSGPYRTWVGTDAVHYALSSLLSRSGLPGRPPLLPPGAMATESAALTAAWAAILAYYNRLHSGVGDDIDVSVLESTVQIIDPGFGMAGSAAGGMPTSDEPRGRPDVGHRYPIFACADGYVRLCILSPRQWRGVFEWLGRPAALSDPALERLEERYSIAAQLYSIISDFIAPKTCDAVVAEGQQFGIPCTALLDIGEVFEAEHYRARDTFVDINTAQGVLRVPNGLIEFDGRRMGVRTPAPGHGEHNTEILTALAELETAEFPSRMPKRQRRPLEGIRVLDLGVIVAGGEVGRLLADMGAEVIKIESSLFPDGSRQSTTGDLVSPVVARGHRNKQSIGINLRSVAGRQLMKQLVATSDVILSNFKPGTMDKLGLSYAELARVNPRIVVARSSAFGPEGPWSGRLGYGPLVRAATGLSALWRYDDGVDSFSDTATTYPDHASARVAALGVVSLLIRRRRTGRGGRVDIAQAEVILSQSADLLALEFLLPGSAVRSRDGRAADAPRGVYAASGDDEWLVIDIRDSTDWQRLVECLGHPSLARDPRFDRAERRVANRTIIDGLVTRWTTTRTSREATEVLQRAGVPAGMVLRVADLLDDEHLLDRGAFTVASHPLVDRLLPSENTPGHFTNIPDVELRPAPLLGQQTREIAERLLNLAPDQINELLAAGVLEENVPPSANHDAYIA
ncbi:CaiB/BaiF CoA transferase family protein [Nocardia jiangxiensis]|uniref:CaiB/BaiF CoA transferase family protein n=1 Tax=Nocardia jiangxiensis TaxID=282685 RepID=UPI000688A42F|nr:CoA transferase [Nocardia jiangxiensis]